MIKISHSLAGPGSLDDLVSLVAEEVCAHLAADRVFLLLADAGGDLHVRAEYPRGGPSACSESALSMPKGQAPPNRGSVSGTVCELAMQGSALFISEAMNDARFQAQESVVLLNLRSVLVAPVLPVGGDVPTGLLYACTYHPDGEVFGAEDVALLEALASQVSIHLDRARVLAEKDRLLGELQAVAASRGRVVEVATHELSTPVQELWLWLSVAQRHAQAMAGSAQAGEGPDAERIPEVLEALARAARSVHGLRARFIEPLRAYYDLEMIVDRLRPGVVSQRDVDVMLAGWRSLASQHRLQTFDRLPAGLWADADLFERAMTALVTNAVNYSEAGSQISIRAARVGDDLVFSVQDEGVGIPARDMPHIGTWLYRGENVANLATHPPGLGMGVYSARRVAEAHGGRLEIESQLGKGTRADLILPAFGEGGATR